MAKASVGNISPYNPEKPRVADTLFDAVELIALTFTIVILLVSFFFRHSIVDGTSMVSTLENAEHLIVSDLFYSPKQGDIIVFEDYEICDNYFSTQGRKALVKRVIATGGQYVTVLDGGNKVFVTDRKIEVDGYGVGFYTESGRIVAVQPLDEPYITPNTGYTHQESIINYYVPEGRLFVMGDNRGGSTDSRRFGDIPEAAVLGKALVRIFPLDKFHVFG